MNIDGVNISPDEEAPKSGQRDGESILYEPGVYYVQRKRPPGRGEAQECGIARYTQSMKGGLQQLLSTITDTARGVVSSFSANQEDIGTEYPVASQDTLPSIIRDTEFDGDGLARTEDGPLVPAYVASQFGFNVPGKFFLDHFYSRLREEAGILPLCPFQACAEFLDFSRLEKVERVNELYSFWDDFGRTLGQVNYEVLMPRSQLLVAILDGGHAIDDGVAAEIGHYATHYPERPIVGIRSDIRLAENPSAPINQAVSYFLDPSRSNGVLFSGEHSYEQAIESVYAHATRISSRC